MQGILERFPSQLSAQTQRRIELAATVVLVLLLAHGLAQLTWTLWPTTSQTAPPPPASSNVDANAGSGQSNDWSQIASLHLFGKAKQQAAQSGDAPIDAPETQLNLTLSGILYDDNADWARAIIAGGSGASKFYQVGDQLPGGATLDAIYKDRVILLRNGRHETLRLPEHRKGTAMEGYNPGESSRDREPRVNVSQSGGDGSLSEYRQQLMDDPAKIQKFMRGQPAMRNGEMVGFKVEPGSNPELFEMAGLQSGDIITSVGNVQVDSPDKGFQIFDALSKSDYVTITVIRNGSQTQIPINFQN